MHRPCFLVLDPEHPGSISTRKLVIETAKFNVITAYSSAEAIESLERFPKIDAAIMDSRVADMPTHALIRALRQIRSNLPIVVIAAPGVPHPADADFVVDSLNPRALLEVLRTVCPSETDAILKHDRDLESSGDV